MGKMREQVKRWLVANVWDGEDRYHSEGDWIRESPQGLQELVEDCLADVLQSQQPAWIPCAERLPTEADGGFDNAVWAWDADVGEASMQPWFQVVEYRDRYNYTHWMPLTRPAPPEVE